MKIYWNIRKHLLLLIFSLAIPLVGLFVFGLYTEIQDDLDDAGITALSIAEIMSLDMTRYVESRQKSLARIADRDLIKAMNASRCDSVMADFRDFDPVFNNIVLLNHKGTVVCSAILINKRISYEKGENFLRMQKEKKFLVGKPSYGKISNKWILPLAHPVFDGDSNLIGLLGAAIDLINFFPVHSKLSLPHDAIMILVTANGVVISSSKEADKWVGKNIRNTKLMDLVLSQDGINHDTRLNGQKMIFGYSHVEYTDWSVLIGVPTSNVLASAYSSARTDGIFGFLIILVTLLIGMMVSNRIEKPIKTISESAFRIANGEMKSSIDVDGPDELVNLARQFNLMLQSRDIAEQSVHEFSEQLGVTMEALNIGTWYLKLHDNSVKHSEYTASLFGMSEDYIFEKYEDMESYIHKNDRLLIKAAFNKALESGLMIESEFRVTWPDTSLHWLSVKARVYNDEFDKPDHIVGIVMDISDQKESDEQLRHLAAHDPLTNLKNRREFDKRLIEVSKRARRENNQYAVLYMDMDQFKIVNDTCGHLAGDELLKQLAYVLQTEVRETDVIARMGGDEFAILLENCPMQKAIELAETIRVHVQDFRFVWEDKIFNTTMSIGLVCVNDNSSTPEQILSAADAACFNAKELGRNRIYVHKPDDQDKAQHLGEMEWVSRLNAALEESRLCLYFQPIEALHTHEAGIHCELLTKMIDEKGNLIEPMAFIPSAERYGLMHTLDRWVINTAFSFFDERYRASENFNLYLCTINISATSLSDESFLDYLQEQLNTYSIKPETICFEITETAAITNLMQARDFIRELKKLGCRFSLDDFGTGMSSFGYLKNLDVDYIKIDGSFVRDMLKDPIDKAMVEAIHAVGHVMGLKTIAEFVESTEILNELRLMQVDYAQGYGIAKPKPIEELGTAVTV